MTPRHYAAPIALGQALEQRITTASTTGMNLIPPGPPRAQGREPLPDEVKDVAALLRLALTRGPRDGEHGRATAVQDRRAAADPARGAGWTSNRGKAP